MFPFWKKPKDSKSGQKSTKKHSDAGSSSRPVLPSFEITNSDELSNYNSPRHSIYSQSDRSSPTHSHRSSVYLEVKPSLQTPVNPNESQQDSLVYSSTSLRSSTWNQDGEQSPNEHSERRTNDSRSNKTGEHHKTLKDAYNNLSKRLYSSYASSNRKRSEFITTFSGSTGLASPTSSQAQKDIYEDFGVGDGDQIHPLSKDYLLGEIHLPAAHVLHPDKWLLPSNSDCTALLATVVIRRQPTDKGGEFGIIMRKIKLLSRDLLEDGTAKETVTPMILLEGNVSVTVEGQDKHKGNESQQNGDNLSFIFPGDLLLGVASEESHEENVRKGNTPLTAEQVLSEVREHSKIVNEMRLLVKPMFDVLEAHKMIYAARSYLPAFRRPFDSTSDGSPSLSTLSSLSEKSFNAGLEDRGAENGAGRRAWLIYRNGYTAVRLLPQQGLNSALENKKDKDDVISQCEVIVEATEQRLTVDMADIDMMNPATFDRSPNVGELPYLSETGVIHVLRQRYGANRWFTWANSVDSPHHRYSCLVALHPLLPPSMGLQHAQAVYGERMVQAYHQTSAKKPDQILEPHIFAVAEAALKSVQAHAKNLSHSRNGGTGSLTTSSNASSAHPLLCFLGFSGSGKSYLARQALLYWTKVLQQTNPDQSPQSSNITAEHVQAMLSLLDAFTCARTLMNTQASRCARLYTIELGSGASGASQDLILRGLEVQLLLLERTRVVRRAENEPTFHIFYYMLAGLSESERIDLYLPLGDDEPNLFLTPIQGEDGILQARRSWMLLCKAVNQLGITESEWQTVCRLLACIYHLGAAGATDTPPSGMQTLPNFAHIAAAQRCAYLMGCSVVQLQQQVFCERISSHSQTHTYKPLISDRTSNSPSPLELLESFVTGLYSEIVQIILYLVNRALRSGQRNVLTLSIFDSPGFQNPASLGRTRGATFEDLCYNYAHEKLLLLHQNLHFDIPRKRLRQEEIGTDWLDEADLASGEAVVQLIEGNEMQDSPSFSTRKVNEKSGILPLLDDAAISGASEEHLVKQLIRLYQEQKLQKNKDIRTLRRVTKTGTFTISHCCGNVNLEYNPVGWLKNCREHVTARNASTLLLESDVPLIRDLAEKSKHVCNALTRSTTRKLLTDAPSSMMNGQTQFIAFKPRSLSMQVKTQMNWLLDLMRRSGSNSSIYFVHCLLPIPNAGLSELRNNDLLANTSTRNSFTNGPTANPTLVPQGEECSPRVELLRQQLRGIQLVALLRAQRNSKWDMRGMTFRDFRLHFDSTPIISQANEERVASWDERRAIQTVLKQLGLSPSDYQLGLSQIFLRHGVRENMESARFSGMSHKIVRLQAMCRTYLVQRKTESLRLKNEAVRCIQRNCALYMELRDWPWWWLFRSVRPLIPVYRSDAELDDIRGELQSCRNKLLSMEKERDELQKLCSEFQNEMIDLKEENNITQRNAAYSTDRLEAEREVTSRLQRELEEVKAKFYEADHARLEIEQELESVKAMRQEFNNALNSDAGSDTGEDHGMNVFKERYLMTKQELEEVQRQLDLRESEHVKAMNECKRQLSKKFGDSHEEHEKIEEELLTSRRRQIKSQQEIADLQHQLELKEQRCSELERKQKRVDAETARFQSKLSEESTLREKLQRERDEVLADKVRSDRQMQDARADLERSQEKVERLTQQLNQLTGGSNDGHSSDEFLILKKSNMELDQKMKELEEELDEQMSQVDSMKQAKLRAEMNLERLRQQNAKQIEERDLELEELRGTLQRRIRQLEQQVEESREERQVLMRERRDLDRQVSELMARDSQRDQDAERKLRKEVKKLRALLKDAYASIEQLRNTQPDDKAIVKQLRDQMEELESQRDVLAKNKRQLEADIEEIKTSMDAALKSKQESDERAASARKEVELKEQQLEEHEEEMNEVLRKYRQSVAQQSADSSALMAQSRELQEVQEQRDQLRKQLAEAEEKARFHEAKQVDRSEVIRWETRCKELEARLDLENASKTRLQNQLERLKEQLEHLEDERDQLATSESNERETARRQQRQMRELKEEMAELETRCVEAEKRRNDAISHSDTLEEELQNARHELKKAMRRIQDLQAIVDDSLQQDGSDSEDDGNYRLSLPHDIDDDAASGDRTSKFLDKVDQVLKRRSSLADVSRSRKSSLGNKPIGSIGSSITNLTLKTPSPQRRYSEVALPRTAIPSSFGMAFKGSGRFNQTAPANKTKYDNEDDLSSSSSSDLSSISLHESKK